MECKLIDFEFVVLKLLMFEVCGIIGVTKIQFSNISGTERVKRTTKKLKNIQCCRFAIPEYRLFQEKCYVCRVD